MGSAKTVSEALVSLVETTFIVFCVGPIEIDIRIRSTLQHIIQDVQLQQAILNPPAPEQ